MTNHEKIKICWISPFPPNPTPLAKISYMLIQDLLKSDKFEITLLTYKEDFVPKELPIKIYPILKRESIGAIIRALKIIKKENFDIIHIISTKFLNGRLFLFITFLLKNIMRIKSKIVISIHEFYPFTSLREFIVGGLYHLFLLRYSDLLLVFFKDYKKLILSKSYYKKKKETVRFISKNVQSMRFEQISASKKWAGKGITPFILFFGFLRPLKGVPYLVTAFKKVKKKFPDLKLVIAGGISIGTTSKSYFNEVKRTISKLNLESDVILTDYIPESEIFELFDLAELVVYPYIVIEQSGALFVALYKGKAVIATNIKGFKVIIEHEKNGILVEPKNPTALAEAIIRILSDKDLKKKLEKSSQKTYNENSFDKLVEKYRQFFLES